MQAVKRMSSPKGVVVHDQAEISKILVNHFSSFLSVISDGPPPSMEVLLQGPCVSSAQRAALIRPFTVTEIKNALFDIN